MKCTLYKKCDAPYPFWGCGSAAAAVKRPTLIRVWLITQSDHIGPHRTPICIILPVHITF